MPRFKRKYKMSRRQRFIVRMVCALLVVLLAYTLFNWKIMPAFSTYATYAARSIAVRRINDAVGQVLKADPVSYNTLMIYQKNNDGQIVAVQANTPQINALKYEIIRQASDALNALPESTINIPLGNVMGGPLFSGRGPNIPLRFSPTEDVDCDITSKFSAAGINQTKQDIYLTVRADMTAMLSDSEATIHVQNVFMVGESVIVGTVPGQYFNVTGSGSSINGADAFAFGSYNSSTSSSGSSAARAGK